jgi:ACR3 family arsenite efflux pump ArsB
MPLGVTGDLGKVLAVLDQCWSNSVQSALHYTIFMFWLQVASGVADTKQVGFWPVAKSVLLFLGVPLLAGEQVG